ncbi:MAG: hypothetical protein RE471_09790 [Ferroplasma sp.]|uniref:PadR family transcriptional regulator n=1 Tax=Ferroplasma sp. TaxID=2591003 RepID=UPI002814E9B3|nr:hypothetical protein [Ferroplasma sp.]WMT51255.1 MAG: hypothetical protein RE471_09790 [Ferroplasma sp.]
MINLELYGKYAYEIIRYLDTHKDAKKTDLFEVTKNVSTLYRTLDKLQKADIINARERVNGRRYIFLSLTDQGKRIAEGLRKAEQEVSGGQLPGRHVLPPNYTDQFKNLSALTHLNVLDDHVAIEEHNYDLLGHDRVVFVYVKLNGNNILRLWCEVDQTFECVHTKYAWSLPDVQAMIQIQRDRGNIKKVK